MLGWVGRGGGFITSGPFFMLSSTEHKLLISHKYEIIKKSSIFRALISLECYFSCS